MLKFLKNLDYETLQEILDAMPANITFVDAKDKVAYFNTLGKRIFAKSTAVIGQPVQLCHPEKSVDRVNKILEDFKSGRRDVAEFWINYHDRLVHVRYFAVRNKNGKYFDCLEVT
jgi:DUF438 domain-containing protein